MNNLPRLVEYCHGKCLDLRIQFDAEQDGYTVRAWIAKWPTADRPKVQQAFVRTSDRLRAIEQVAGILLADLWQQDADNRTRRRGSIQGLVGRPREAARYLWKSRAFRND